MKQLSDPPRRGRAWLPGVIGIGSFAVLLGVLYFAAGSDDAETPPVASVTAPAVTPVSHPQPSQAAGQPLTLEDPATNGNVDARVRVEGANAPRVVAQSDRQSALVRGHLDAGEFHLALAIARDVQDPIERRELLNTIFEAQMAAGEFDAALASVQQMDDGYEQLEASRELTEGETLAGGGQADFTQLIDLIQQNTGTPDSWANVNGGEGTITPYNTGVRVDPHGLLDRAEREDRSGRLAALARQARVADLQADMAQATEVRFLSLRRLEEAVAERLANGQPIPSSMQNLAGLTSIKYLVAEPNTGDILIGGPAEGWRVNENGQAVGIDSGRPVMQLDDLVTVLRTFSPTGLGIFTVSIKPRESGLKRLKEFVEASNRRGPLSGRSATQRWAKKMEQELGLQDIVFEGVPTDTRVARVIIEADYKMKLIGIDKLDAAKIPSFFDLLSSREQQNPPSIDALRWWLTMNYDAVLHSPEKTAFEFEGSSVKCLSENELINDLGERVQTGKTDGVNEAFAKGFTARYEDLAREDLVFADLQNVFDLALVAAIVRKHHLDQRVNWNRGVFSVNGDYQPRRYPVPQTVHSVVNTRTYRGGRIVAQVAGGVRADLMAVVNDNDVMRLSPGIDRVTKQAGGSAVSNENWWWNAR